MIKIIDKKNRDLKAIAGKHFKKLEPVLKRAITDHLPAKHAAYISKRLEKIIVAEPAELLQLNRNYYRFCRNNHLKPSRKISIAFSYDNFLQRKAYNPYHLARELGVNICPYCNRQYTFTITHNRRQVTRPEFDHFFSQEFFPLLALSFYNLIPCCAICNSRLKGRKQFKLNTHLHPYLHGFENDLTFGYTAKNIQAATGMSNDLKVELVVRRNAANGLIIKGNCDAFKLEAIYQEHGDSVREIVRKHYVTGGKYLQLLAKAIPAMHTNAAELYQLAFGNYYDAVDFDRRPLGKLTKDIFQGLKFTLPR